MDKLMDNFRYVLDGFFSVLTKNQAEVLKEKFGYNNHLKVMTYAKISTDYGVTRQNIQCTVITTLKKLRKQKHAKWIQPLVTNADRILAQYSGVAHTADSKEDAFFSSNPKALFFLINLLSELLPDKYITIAHSFLCVLGPEELQNLHSGIIDTALAQKLPLNPDLLITRTAKQAGVSRQYAQYYLITVKHTRAFDNLVYDIGPPGLSLRLEKILARFSKPTHEDIIIEAYKKQYGDTWKRTKNIKRAILLALQNNKMFLQPSVAHYLLKALFKKPHQYTQIIEKCRKILKDCGGSANIRYVLVKLEDDGIDTGKIDKFTLKKLLLDHGFYSCGSYQICILPETQRGKTEYLYEEVYRIISESPVPISATNILEILYKHRRVKRWAVYHAVHIARRKHNDIIKTEAGLYGVKRHLTLPK